MAGFGSPAQPYREMPLAGYSTEVHWGGANYAVLTVTMSEMNSINFDEIGHSFYVLPDGVSDITLTQPEWGGGDIVTGVRYVNLFYVELIASGGGVHADFDSIRLNYLIDFAALKAAGLEQVVINQAFSNNLAPVSDVPYRNQYELHTYRTGDFSIPHMEPGTGALPGTAGPNDFRMVPASREAPVYDQFRTVLWNFGEEVSTYYPVLIFTSSGWGSAAVRRAA